MSLFFSSVRAAFSVGGANVVSRELRAGGMALRALAGDPRGGAVRGFNASARNRPLAAPARDCPPNSVNPYLGTCSLHPQQILLTIGLGWSAASHTPVKWSKLSDEVVLAMSEDATSRRQFLTNSGRIAGVVYPGRPHPSACPCGGEQHHSVGAGRAAAAAAPAPRKTRSA